MTNIYLDIDGVLLANENNPANHAQEFLTYVLENYPDTTYWLTTHCRGDAEQPIKNIGHLFNDTTIELMRKIKATNWDIAKTEAIDFSKPFLWFDDDCFDDEKAILIEKDLLGNWIEMNLSKDENQLLKLIENFPTSIL